MLYAIYNIYVCFEGSGWLQPRCPVAVDHVPVLLERTQGVAHRMGIFHHDQGKRPDIAVIALAIFLQLLMAWVHRTEDVGVHILVATGNTLEIPYEASELDSHERIWQLKAATKL